MLCVPQGRVPTSRKIEQCSKIAYESLRQEVPALRKDRVLHKDIEKAADIIRSSELLRTLEDRIGTLK